ncbi:hypothetical protein ABH995_000770 [Bradyrhizobium yuanmingense]
MPTYYTDREYGARAPAIDTINELGWPVQPGRDPDRGWLVRIPLARAVSRRQRPPRLRRAVLPQGPVGRGAMDRVAALGDRGTRHDRHSRSVLEFCSRSVGEPVQGPYHSFFRHHHLSWDREPGFARFADDVKMLFRRNKLAFRAHAVGRGPARPPHPRSPRQTAGRCSRPAMARPIDCSRAPASASCRPGLEDRQDALEKLPDAFERLKTLEPEAYKRVQADALLDRVAAPRSGFRQALAPAGLLCRRRSLAAAPASRSRRQFKREHLKQGVAIVGHPVRLADLWRYAFRRRQQGAGSIAADSESTQRISIAKSAQRCSRTH